MTQEDREFKALQDAANRAANMRLAKALREQGVDWEEAWNVVVAHNNQRETGERSGGHLLILDCYEKELRKALAALGLSE